MNGVICTVDGWNVYDNTHGFYCVNDGKTLYFTAEYKNGTIFTVKSYFDGKRCYTANRYLHKMTPLVREITFQLLHRGCLWDYKNNRSALESYKKDIAPYYQRCKSLGMETSVFLDALFAD